MADCIPFKTIPYYSKLILDYLEQSEVLRLFYHRFPSMENLKDQLHEKEKHFPDKNRKVLVAALEKQYRGLDLSKQTAKNIADLADERTFTITTGHQLNLFTGPLYFFYKIISTINLTKALKQKYPDYNFVPVFWMASEDHDFEEINFFNFGKERIWWDSDQTGAVGVFSTEGLEAVWTHFKDKLNASENAKTLSELFRKAYCGHDTLSVATRYLANALFKDHGLVILDGDDRGMKTLFSPYVKEELLNQTAFKKVSAAAEGLAKMHYKVQVNPREINLFYLSDGTRQRIVRSGDVFLVNETEKRFSKEGILTELDAHPERFSPNAIMRPLFQEVALPNLCYIGGSGELAYWLELKGYFDAVGVVFPSLLLRNSALLVSEKQDQKRRKLNLSNADLFLPQADLMAKQTRALSAIPMDFSPQKAQLQKQFADLYKLAEKTDKSFLGAVAAQEKKQLNGLAHLEKRLLKAQKRKLRNELARASELQDAFFPNGILQERETNFSYFYATYGEAFIAKLFKELSPLAMAFSIVRL